MPRYRLFLVDGTDAGEFRSSVPNWERRHHLLVRDWTTTGIAEGREPRT